MCESKEGKLNDTDIFGSCENNQGNTKGLQCEKSIRKMWCVIKRWRFICAHCMTRDDCCDFSPLILFIYLPFLITFCCAHKQEKEGDLLN